MENILVCRVCLHQKADSPAVVTCKVYYDDGLDEDMFYVCTDHASEIVAEDENQNYAVSAI